MRLTHKLPINERGVTLVELMIVVAIVGILAALGSVAYGRYIDQGNITKLKQTALEVASGQERYRARNNAYFTPGGDFATEPDKYKNLLDFGGTNVSPGVVVNTQGWAANDTCGLCAAEGIAYDGTSDGYVVVVSRDLDPSEADDTTAYIVRGVQSPVILHEGK